jgi:hypothetical protein
MGLCAGIKADGGRCKAQAIRESQWCFNHHPDYEQARRQRASRGGKRGGRGRPLSEVARIQSRLEELAEGVLDGSVDKSKASIAGQLYNFALRAVSVTLKAREQEELVGRLEQLEEHLESQRQGYGSYGA